MDIVRPERFSRRPRRKQSSWERPCPGYCARRAIFRENDIDKTVLLTLTAEDLKELGVTSFGHRRKLLDAIAALRADTSAQGLPVT